MVYVIWYYRPSNARLYSNFDIVDIVVGFLNIFFYIRLRALLLVSLLFDRLQHGT
jgi:hypothetical protein